jgi:signal transduction histidine kinase
MGLRTRLSLLVILPIMAVVGGYGIMRVRQETLAALETEQRAAAVAALAVQIAVEQRLRTGDTAAVGRLVAELVRHHPQVESVRVLERSGRLLGEEPRSARADDLPEAARDILAGGGARVRVGASRTVEYLLPLKGERGEILGLLEMSLSTRIAERRLTHITWDVLWRLGWLATILAVLLGLVVQWQVLRPLARLAEAIRALGEGRPGPPLPVARGDELGAVAGAFNGMVDQLEAARRRLTEESEHVRDLEQHLRRAETLAVAGKLTSALAHEVGTPLNVISGRAEMALRLLPADHPARQELDVVVAQTDRIAGIIRSILDAMRGQKPEMQRIALGPLVTQLVPLAAYDTRRRGVAFEARLPDDLPAVSADPGQLRQVFLNLIVNALDATPRGGRIAIEVRRASHGDCPGVLIEVSDTGGGIPAEVLPRVFDAFFTTKPAGRGTGLGLAISRDIVREHGGAIDVRSGEGEGTTVSVWLPGAEAAA